MAYEQINKRQQTRCSIKVEWRFDLGGGEVMTGSPGQRGGMFVTLGEG